MISFPYRMQNIQNVFYMTHMERMFFYDLLGTGLWGHFLDLSIYEWYILLHIIC